MQVTQFELPNLLLFSPKVFQDERGFFVETYQQQRYQQLGVDVQFVQDNHSRSTRGVLRGMHFQQQPGQAKLVRVARGEIYDVAVDMRPNSPTFGRWQGVTLNDQDQQQLYVPVGFAHGFCVLSEQADVIYKVSSAYDGAMEKGFAYNDPDVGIEWPIADPAVSDRDRNAPSFAQACQVYAP